MEIWARCPECVRWFYCGRVDNGATAAPSGCPVCGAEPHETVISEDVGSWSRQIASEVS